MCQAPCLPFYTVSSVLPHPAFGTGRLPLPRRGLGHQKCGTVAFSSHAPGSLSPIPAPQTLCCCLPSLHTQALCWSNTRLLLGGQDLLGTTPTCLPVSSQHLESPLRCPLQLGHANQKPPHQSFCEPCFPLVIKTGFPDWGGGELGNNKAGVLQGEGHSQLFHTWPTAVTKGISPAVSTSTPDSVTPMPL